MKEKQETRYSPVGLRVNRYRLTPGPGWDSFMEKHVFMLIRRDAPEEEIETAPEYKEYRETPLDKGDVEEDAAEGENSTDGTKTESTGIMAEDEAYARWQHALTEALLRLRAAGDEVSRIFIKGGSLVMYGKEYAGQAEALFTAAEKKAGEQMHRRVIHPFLYTPDYAGHLWDIVNLLGTHMVYGLAKKTGSSFPEGVLPYGYRVHTAGSAVSHETSGAGGKWLRQAKNSFCSVYIKDGILHTPLSPYYEYGEWAAGGGQTRKWRKSTLGFRYSVVNTDNGWLLAEGMEGNLTDRAPYPVTGKGSKSSITMRAVGTGDAAGMERTRTAITEHWVHAFNSAYAGTASLSPEIWKGVMDTGLALGESRKGLLEERMNEINAWRSFMAGSRINIFSDSVGTAEMMSRLESDFRDTMQWARYSAVVAVCPGDTVSWGNSAGIDMDERVYAVYAVIRTGKNGKPKKEKDMVLLENGGDTACRGIRRRGSHGNHDTGYIVRGRKIRGSPGTCDKKISYHRRQDTCT